MERFCDLHTHSYYSDGTFSPAQLLEAAQQQGLSAVALCDHNTVAGLPEFLTAARDHAVEAVPGVEFSTDYEGTELHILALFVRPAYFETITDMMAELLLSKERSNIALVETLRQAGVTIDYDRVKAASQGGYVNRAHIAAEMVRQGDAASIQEAFITYLSPDKGFYVPPKRLDAFDAIRFIKSIGAAAVLAHPFLNLDEKQLRVFLKKAAQWRLDAMETLYPLYDTADTLAAKTVADEFNLLHSGGSDFHGANKPDIRLGTGKGELRVPMELLEKLRARASDI